MEYWSTPVVAEGWLGETAMAQPAVGMATFRGYEAPHQCVPRLLAMTGLPANVFYMQVFMPRPPCFEQALLGQYFLMSHPACSHATAGQPSSTAAPAHSRTQSMRLPAPASGWWNQFRTVSSGYGHAPGSKYEQALMASMAALHRRSPARVLAWSVAVLLGIAVVVLALMKRSAQRRG